MEETAGATPDVPPMPPVPPSPPPKRRRTVLLAVAAAVVIAGVSSGTTALLMSGSDDSPSKAESTADTPVPAAPAEDTTEVTEESYNDSPGPDDFALTLKITHKQCFGSAGCNITVEPSMTYINLTPLDPDQTISITYEVRGDESGPVIETMELTNQDQLNYTPVSISTPSKATKVTAKVTDVQASE